MYSVLCLHQSPWGLTSQHFDTSLCLFRLFRWPGMFSTHFQSHSENVTTFHSLTLMVPLLAGQSRFLFILNWPLPLLCSLYTWFMLSLQSLWIIVTTLCLCPPSYLKHVKFFVLSTLSGVVVLPNSFSVLILMVSNICVNAAMKLDKEMATHSSVLAWRIPGTVEPGGLPSMGSYRVRHDWSDLAAAAMKLKDTCSLEEKLWPI